MFHVQVMVDADVSIDDKLDLSSSTKLNMLAPSTGIPLCILYWMNGGEGFISTVEY